MLDMTEPSASSTDLDVKFSDGMSTSERCCRRFSCSMMSKSSGSVCERGALSALAAARVAGEMSTAAVCAHRRDTRSSDGEPTEVKRRIIARGRSGVLIPSCEVW